MANLKIEGGGQELTISNKGTGELPEEKFLIDKTTLKEIIEKYCQVIKKSLDLVNCGMIFAWGGNIADSNSSVSIPEGYLLCDGAAYNISDYENLYAVIGDLYIQDGDANNENFNEKKFRVPNLIGRFLEGSNTNSEYHQAGLPNITGWYTTSRGSIGADGAFRDSGGWGNNADWGNSGGYSIHNFDASRCSKIYGRSTTVQPEALTCRYIIKY